ncbi:Cysteine desulfurase [Lentibacillus sp. JNUCC-1]|uniref:aminotransferase class V-fold PLP-dependent enzyme n=1 Tax=Lentibacillus sp. JNUCC-1 TaxID=2654513 RepID=UPI00132C4930|nr:aminotransferase class V-fold PLP-dependent enzyme [Lentibacillus sp. JNUCC-1]MUV37677.1 Cysteine desulfurase [Lentibacillus sp. JNUCC-1]
MNKDHLIKTFEQARGYFPALTETPESEPIYYLDNSAGTQVSRFVTDRINTFFTDHNAQKGTIFKREKRMSEKILEARQLAADLVGAKDHTEIALGLNASSFFQAMAHHLARDFKPGDHIVVSEIGHWSNIDPWQELEERGIHVHMWRGDADGNLDWAHFDELLALSPKVVAVGWVSNATGTISDIKKVAEAAHKAGALVVVDAVQQVPHLPTDFTDADIDFAAFSGYKVFGPHLGFGYFNRQHPERLEGYRIKEMLSQDATAFEIGTQNHEGIHGFIGAMAYLEQFSKDGVRNGLSADIAHVPATAGEERRKLYHAMHLIKAYEQILSDYFFEKLSGIEGVELYGVTARDRLEERVPVFAFNIEGWSAEEIGSKLDAFGIEARTGNFHNNDVKQLAKRFGGSAVRISMIHYNALADIDYLFQCLEQILDVKVS